jgi:porin
MKSTSHVLGCCAAILVAEILLPAAAHAQFRDFTDDVPRLVKDSGTTNANRGKFVTPVGHQQPTSSACGSSCGDDFWTRTSLTNGLWGAGQKMAESGIVADLQFTQFYQGVTSGGVEQEFFDGGKLDYNFIFLGGKLGLNKGFTLMMHAETRYGQDVNSAAGALAFPNANMLYPAPGRDVTSITSLFAMQALSEKWALTAGKYNSLDLFDMLYPHTGRGIDGFMNAALIVPLGVLRTTNLSFNGGGVLGLDGEQINSALLVYDTTNSTTTVGLSDLFDQGAVVLGYYRIPTKSGSHGFLANWSSRTYTSTDPLSWTVIPGEGITPGQENGSWTAVYFLDHMVWEDRCNKARNVRLFSTWSIADEGTSPIGWTGTVALQGTGLVGGRESDTTGAGYFYTGLSNDFRNLVNQVPNIDVQDVQGVEVYYNAAITPWFHLTVDAQAVDNNRVSDDTAFILGLRANIKL